MYAINKGKGYNQESKGKKLLEGEVGQLFITNKGKGYIHESKERKLLEGEVG